jgi:diguanylate cyclase (GGDEF)-like protein
VRYRILYTLVGIASGTGAPLGALLIRLATGAVSSAAEIRTHLFYYVYELIGSCLVFGIAGFIAGRRADRFAASEEEFRQLAIHDELTGLSNQRAFEQRYRRAIGRSFRFREPLSLLLVDIDGLKTINDQWGHAVGSEALRHVARILEAEKRSDDMAARWGGDEFVVLMPGAEASAAQRVAERILDRVRDSRMESAPLRVTVTIGIVSEVASSPDHDFFGAADRALYQGKAAGRDTSRFHSAVATSPPG